MTSPAAVVRQAFTEGDADRVVVGRFLEGDNYTVLTAPGGGRTSATATASAALHLSGARIVLALDLNGGTSEELFTEVERALLQDHGAAKVTRAPDGRFSFLDAQLVVWPIGLPTAPDLTDLGIKKHEVEDLLIKALLDEECLRRWAESEKQVKIPAGSQPWGTVKKLLKVARDSGFDLSSSKQVLWTFLPLVGYRASAATLATKLIKSASGTGAEAIFRRPAAFTLPGP